MWRVYEVEDYVRVPPSKFGEPIETVAIEELKRRYEDAVFREFGFVVAVFDVKVDRKGIVMFGDGASYHKARFKILSFVPMEGEVVEGEVVSVREIGLIVRVGPITALIHRLHIMDEPNVFFDKQAGVFIGGRSKRRIGKGDTVRARISGVSYITTEGGLALRATMTMRMLGLGKLEWIREDLAPKRRPTPKK